MKKVFKIVLFFVLSFGVCFAKDIKFIQITDINLNTNNANNLNSTIKEINSFNNIDFVVFGGNNISKTNIDNLNTFIYLIKKLNKRSVVLLGSTDVLSTTGIDKKYYLKKINRVLLTYHRSEPNFVFKKKGFVFIVMDGSKQYFQTPNGYYTKSELKWLDKELNKYKNKDVIILAHFPIQKTKSSWLETKGIEEFREVLSKYNNVKMMISGHYGYDFETKENGIYFVITESYSKQGAYKIIELDTSDNFIGTNLVK